MSNDTVGRSEAPEIYLDTYIGESVYEPAHGLADLRADRLIEVCMVERGNGLHLVLDQAIPCREGDIFVTPPGVPHGFFLESAEEGLTIRQLRFSADELPDKEVSLPEGARYCYGLFCDGSITAYALLNSLMRERIGALYDTIEHELAEKGSEWHDLVCTCLAQLLIHVKRYIDSSIKNASPVSTKEWNAVLTTTQIVKGQYADCSLTLAAIAAQLYISKSHLSKTFHALTGTPFSEYLRKIRMEHACHLLRESPLTVEEIVRDCGLRDVSTFYKNFSAFTGMTPTEYRQSTKKESIKTEKKERIMVILSDISENLQKGKSKIVKELVQQALDEGSNPEQILTEGLLAGMSVIGEKFKNNEVYVPEVLVAARAMNAGAQILKPHLIASGVKATGRVCIGTVQGDLHDIGKNLVKMMMEGRGLEVIDLGTDVPPEAFVQTAIEQDCRIICCSALLTTTMGVMADVVKAAEDAGVRDKIKIMIGGAPVNEEFCRQIGADCYTVDAASAADAAVALCKSC